MAFQLKLLNSAINRPEACVASDSAFPVGGALHGKIITPLKSGDLERLRPGERRGAQQMHAAITSIRQAAEWGMGAVERVWRILQQRLPFDPRKRRQRLNNIHRLYNVRVRTSGISEIRTVFDAYRNQDTS